ncbi:hypothetical protein HBI56_073810 [Parastagonospora nodorum]|uniref:Uncharacterized protein n=1 Tax=Phaeosphaeria nodorum (strain SN15 / ATCC MYA-4574 / FGSC 10173) TaxID=321614 RepID=A0A7U2F0N5_PHANO|nr:hypothetical protein HBH56_171170 [Parastagonospora nodorum]QRC94505.1 hypothetical protein JI435_405930 [Parastagonospora nodorum SN15]KAH3928681.1 hypothetical protein HBH54_139730 [Parastagonospora nodorum]KAH3945475.1 hypothetical protein HBH53_145080 [Parastagonospora nodorum]KAH3984070.1 hypothetical protein HBH52_059140 [Parastagonospora nodorum]
MIFHIFLFTALCTAYSNPKDALINPRGEKVCMQQCGTSALKCPEAFWKEQFDMCYRCCAVWGETVIRVRCDEGGTGNGTMGRKGNETATVKEKDKGKNEGVGRELGFS